MYDEKASFDAKNQSTGLVAVLDAHGMPWITCTPPILARSCGPLPSMTYHSSYLFRGARHGDRNDIHFF